ncbi:MAG: outer membrane beta-barrel protein [Deltaproteobacteria bacterium]|nr:outer membrane beta-barrel protein [Deltaproteobacteria bacterium]
MLKIVSAIVFVSLLSFSPVVVATENNSAGIELNGGITGCLGSYCESGTPFLGGGITPIVRTGKNIALGFNFQYGTFKDDSLDSVYYYSFGLEGRYYFNLTSSISIYTGAQLNYTTLMINVGEDSDKDFSDLRATGPGFSVLAGLEFAVTKSFNVGFNLRYSYPIWSEACFTADQLRICREPQDSDIKLELMPFFAGITLSYLLPE